MAVEVEGGIWQKGRHTTGTGFLSDCEKYNEATCMGWKVLRYPVNLIDSGVAAHQIEQMIIALREPEPEAG